MANIRNPIERIEPMPGAPGMGIGYFRDGSQMPASMQVLQQYAQQATQQNRAEQLAQNDVGFANPNEQNMSRVVSPPSPRSPEPNYTDAGPEQANSSQMNYSPAGEQSSQMPEPPHGQNITPEQKNQIIAMTNDDLRQQALIQALTEKKYVPGRAGFDPAKARAEGSYVPKVRETQVTAGPSIDQKELRKLEQMEMDRAESQAQIGVYDEYAKQEMAKMKWLDQVTQRTELENQYRNVQSAWQAEYSKILEEGRAAANQKIDEKRFQRSMGFGAKLSLIIGAAMQGYATKGGRNDALSSLMQYVHEDIQAQEFEITNRRQHAENELSRLAQRWGSVEAAKEALAIQKIETIKAKWESMAQHSQTPSAIATKQLALQDLEIQQQQRRMDLQAKAQGTTVQNTQEVFMQPVKAIAGRYRNPTGKERLESLKLAGEAGVQMGNSVKLQRENLNPEQHKSGEQVRLEIAHNARMSDFAKAILENRKVSATAQRIWDKLGATVDKAGNITLGKNYGTSQKIATELLDSIAPGAADLFWAAVDPDTGAINREKMDIAARRMNEVSGAAFTENEWRNNLTILGQASLASPESMAREVKRMLDQAQEKELILRAGYKDVEQGFDQNLRDVRASAQPIQQLESAFQRE